MKRSASRWRKAPFDTLSENICRYGRHIIGVTDEEGNKPHYFYSIGNSKSSSIAAEFLCFWHSDAAARVINRVADFLKNHQEVFNYILSHGGVAIGGILINGEDVYLRLLSGECERDARENYACQLDNPEYTHLVNPHKIIQILIPNENGYMDLVIR